MANLADELRVERRPHANSEDPRRARTHQNAHRAKPNAASVQRRPPSSTAAGVTLSGRTSSSTKPGVNAILSTRACPAQPTPSPECTITRQALTHPNVTANGGPHGPRLPFSKEGPHGEGTQAHCSADPAARRGRCATSRPQAHDRGGWPRQACPLPHRLRAGPGRTSRDTSGGAALRNGQVHSSSRSGPGGLSRSGSATASWRRFLRRRRPMSPSRLAFSRLGTRARRC